LRCCATAGLANPPAATAPIAAVRNTSRRVSRSDRAPIFPVLVILFSAVGVNASILTFSKNRANAVSHFAGDIHDDRTDRHAGRRRPRRS
jgi:hypothetical protein